ncbi:MAG: diacylglycerol kinase family protein [Thermoguttaceae bacterium]
MPPVVSIAKPSPDARRVAILLNPKAGPRGAEPRAQWLAELLRCHGFQPEIFTDLAAVAAQANRWHAERTLRALVGIGGDGTAAELINRTDDGVPLTFLAAGNSNLLARYFSLSNDPERVCRTIHRGVLARVDAGRANGRLFSLMVGCGFDAEVVRRVHEYRDGHISHLTYGVPILKAIAGYKYPELHIHWGAADQSATLSARWLFVFNLPCYGGGLRIAPQADGADGLLDMCTFRRGGFWPGLWYLATVLAGQHQRIGRFGNHRVTRLRITADAEVPYQLDGDPGGTLPLDIDVLPGRLTLLLPPNAVTPAVPG